MLDLLPDLFDQYPQELRLLNLPWLSFGQKNVFSGQIVTVKCFEDNSKVKSVLAEPGDGKVLVVDGGGSMRRALLGDLIAQSAVDNGWQGIVIYGCIRDVATINTMDIGVKALGVNPIKTDKRDLGDIGVSLEINSIEIVDGMMLYADLNGVAISDSALSL
ncbi:putative 4-hydroxy-4-methyl-2-oxoglutarate aldolase [Shewanella sp. OMA3-2]|uniref:putative 4-hydroxy-4-methyl-2-oxoglutarate aldolase n=1 Tax=Shewanella sp. OMA3-2 TaxID=2908650 RepID=UPI001F391A03|nr:putative 4-hydroxy-4-methyl-2-oxoglutarate aldolase [Shewanella sp. OMA3-2]UJF20735.1 putative 4-hydroxy-4-methyl-2-oxoglutarate aldolase [Shewanella sp. OMA3-2]